MKWVGLDLVDKQGQANTLNRERDGWCFAFLWGKREGRVSLVLFLIFFWFFSIYILIKEYFEFFFNCKCQFTTSNIQTKNNVFLLKQYNIIVFVKEK